MFILKAPVKSARRKHWKKCESIFRRKSLPPNYEQVRMDYRNVRFKKCWYQREHHYLATLIVGYTKETWNKRNNICIFFIKTPRCNCVPTLCPCCYNCCFVICRWLSLSIFTWTHQIFKSEMGRGLNFNDFLLFFFCQGTRQAIFKIFQIWAKYPRLERISSYVFFIWNICEPQLFICNHYQTNKQ